MLLLVLSGTDWIFFMGLGGEGFSKLFMRAAETATGALRNVRGLNSEALETARGVSSQRVVGMSSGAKRIASQAERVVTKGGSFRGEIESLAPRGRLGGSNIKSLSQGLKQMDYDAGPLVLHSSTASGLSEISPSVSAAAKQSHYGLAPSDAVVFAFKPSEYKGAEESLRGTMSEVSSEAARQGTGGGPTYYLARAPRSGIRTHADLPSTWAMSSKPMQVVDSITDTGHNTEEVLDFIARATGGDSVATKALKHEAEQKAMLESLKVVPKPGEILP